MWRLIAFCVLIHLAIPQTGLAQEREPDEVAVVASTPPGDTPPPGDLSVRKNYFVPIFDTVVFEFLLNRYGERVIDRGTYDVDASSIRRNLHSSWVLDSDPFSTNQFMHPYQGAM